MKQYDTFNFPSHWKMIDGVTPESTIISFRRAWNFDKSAWDVQGLNRASSGTGIHRTLGSIRCIGYMEGNPLYRHSLQDENDESVFKGIDLAQRDLLDSYLLIAAL